MTDQPPANTELIKALEMLSMTYYDDPGGEVPTVHEVLAIIEASTKQQTDKVNRLEVIDDTGRAYVKGAIYGSPVSVELSYQDDDRTLKVFVKNNKQEPRV